MTDRRQIAIGALLLAVGVTAQAQIPVLGQNGFVRIQNTDLAVLEAGEERKDLPCEVTPDKAFLGFDLRFHAGFDVAVPLRELSGSENLLTILFRVVAENQKDSPRYFVQRIRVPSVEEEAKGDAFLQGAFDLGEGKYHVSWLMRDRAERVCASSWDVEAALPQRDKAMALAISPSAIEAAQFEQFHEEPPVDRTSAEAPLNLKVLVNFAPQKANASTMRPLDTAALVSILRSLFREPRIGKFSLVAFNLHEQRILYRQDNVDRIDFGALGTSLKSLNLGTTDLKRLADKKGETNFLAELISKEFPANTPKPDAIVFAGPKVMLETNVADEQIRGLGEFDYPVFYMNYILNPQATPWRDAIGNAVRTMKGVEYTISRPRDLWSAVSEMVTRIVKFRNGKQVAAVSTR